MVLGTINGIILYITFIIFCLNNYIVLCCLDKSIHHEKYVIPHIKQQFNWDCGVACVLMLLSEEERNYFIKNFFQICQEEGFGMNTWTIDLCYLLKRFQIKHRMHTTRRAANCKYRDRGSNIAIKDDDRIRNRFENASAKGIEIVDGALSTQELIEHVFMTGPAIVLVDAGLLSCDLCKHNKLASEFRSMFGGLYRGHYVVIIGSIGRKLMFRDPARAAPVCLTTFHRFHDARRAHGTDYDVILVYNKK